MPLSESEEKIDENRPPNSFSPPNKQEENEQKPILSSVTKESLNNQGFAPVFQNRRFLLLWLGQVFSQIADKIYLIWTIALISLKFQTGEQPISGWVSGVMIANTIPAVLFGSLAGVYVDRWSKKAVLVISNLLRGILVLGVPLLFWLMDDDGYLFHLPVNFLLLLGITFFVSTLTQFFAPAEQATIPLLVKRQNLLSANSLYTTTMMVALIVGFAVGEPLLEKSDQLFQDIFDLSFGREFLVGGSYVVAGIILLLLQTGEKDEHLPQDPPHPWEDIQDGIRYLQSNHRVRNALIQLVIMFSVFAALAVLAVGLAESIPEMKAQQFGFLLAAGGVGLALGAAVLGNWGQSFPHARLSLWGSIGVAISLMGLSLLPHHLWLVLLLTVILGAFASLVGVPMQTTIQAETPPEMRGKVFGLQNNAVNIALSLPLALVSVAEAYFGLNAVFLGLAVLAAAGGILTWYIYRKSSL
jgi:predicted MFS family arabinose efflux permease